MHRRVRHAKASCGKKKEKLAAGGDLSKRPPPAAHATFDDGQATLDSLAALPCHTHSVDRQPGGEWKRTAIN